MTLEEICTTDPETWLVAADLMDDCGDDNRLREIAQNPGHGLATLETPDGTLAWYPSTDLLTRHIKSGRRRSALYMVYSTPFAALKAVSNAMVQQDKFRG